MGTFKKLYMMRTIKFGAYRFPHGRFAVKVERKRRPLAITRTNLPVAPLSLPLVFTAIAGDVVGTDRYAAQVLRWADCRPTDERWLQHLSASPNRRFDASAATLQPGKHVLPEHKRLSIWCVLAHSLKSSRRGVESLLDNCCRTASAAQNEPETSRTNATMRVCLPFLAKGAPSDDSS